MEALPRDIHFLPSTLEHRPLKAVEKQMLLRHFETDGHFDMDALAHWHHACSPELRMLEGWVWGMRYWGRETLFRVAYYGYKLCRSLWEQGDAAESADVTKIKMGMGGNLQELTELCLRWAKIPGEELAYAILQARGPDPQAWINAEIAEKDREGVHAFTLMAHHRMASATLEPRDEAARMASQSMVCAARALMASGKSETEAIVQARQFLILEMRRWFGRKW